MPGITIKVGSTAELRRLARRLNAAGSGGLERDVQAELRRAAVPVLAATKAKVRGASFTGSKGGHGAPDTSTGLRSRLAAATVKTDHGNGVRFKVLGPQVDNRYGTRLAKLSDTELAPRWRHPVFKWSGRRSTRWTTQVGQPWFFVTIRAGQAALAAGVRKAMEATARKITG